MKEHIFIGKNTNQERARLSKALSDNNAAARADVKDSFKLKGQEKNSIQLAIKLVRDELSQMGFTDFAISNEDIFVERGGVGEGVRGGYFGEHKIIGLFSKETVAGKVYSLLIKILTEHQEEVDIGDVKTLIHEITHGESHHKYEAGKNGLPNFYRLGYKLKGRKDGKIYFQGFNEAVVDKITLDIMSKFLGSGKAAKFNNFIFRQGSIYLDYIRILEDIIRNVAQTKSISQEEVWQKIKEGQFSGNMMHLRVIEEVYGKGALRKLASLGQNLDGMPQANFEGTEKIADFFHNVQK